MPLAPKLERAPLVSAGGGRLVAVADPVEDTAAEDALPEAVEFVELVLLPGEEGDGAAVE